MIDAGHPPPIALIVVAAAVIGFLAGLLLGYAWE
jgi:hypothetical protein